METAAAKRSGANARRLSEKSTRILAIESDRYARNFLSQMLGEFGTVKLIKSGPEVFEVAKKYKPNLVVLALNEQDLNGLCMCRWLKQTWPDVCIVLITNEESSAEFIREFSMVDGQLSSPIDSRELRSLFCQLLESQLRSRSSRSEENRYDRIQTSFACTARYAANLKTADQTLATLLMFAEMKDQGAAHLTRVQAYAQCIARQLRQLPSHAELINDQFLADLEYASQLHDIGNVVVGDELRNRAGALTEIEYETIKMHTNLGADLLKASASRSSETATMEMAERVARCHHEHWDGNGYPSQLSGDEIPLEARIVAVADVYDALTSSRSFRQSFTPELARNVIQNESGQQFDPEVVTAFMETFQTIEVTGEAINERFERESDTVGETVDESEKTQRSERLLQDYREKQLALQKQFRSSMTVHIAQLKSAYSEGEHQGIQKIASDMHANASKWGLTETTQCALELQNTIQRSESVEQVGIKLQQLLSTIDAS